MTATEPVEQQATDMHFGEGEIDQFEQDDISAGRTIGVMLAVLFIYTVVAMSFVAAWTVFQ